VVSYGGEQITEELASEALGLASRDVFFQLLEAIRDRDSKAVLNLVAKVEEQGWDMEDFADGLLDHLRYLLLAKVGPESPELAGFSESVAERLRKQAEQAEEEDLLRMISLVSDVEKDLKYANRPRFLLEMLAVKLAKMDTTVQLNDLMQDLNRILDGGTPKSKKPPADKPTIRMAPDPQPPTPSPSQEAPKESAAAQPAPPLPDPEGQTRDLWDQMVDRVTKKKSSLGALLQHGQLGNLQEKSMIIAFPKSCSFHRERAQKEREVIEEEASAILGKDVRIKFTLADLPEPQLRNTPMMESPTKKLSVKEVVKTEPIVRMILDKMDGELIE
jgi:DNA polymerase-3 subunit gamma/tau